MKISVVLLTKGAKMSKSKYFTDRLSEQAQKLLKSDPKQFQTLYRDEFICVIKQDMLHLATIAFPIFEKQTYHVGYDIDTRYYRWFKIAKGHEKEATDMLKTYFGDYNLKYSEFTGTVPDNAKPLFTLLRATYFYNNYTNKRKLLMSDIKIKHYGEGIYKEYEYEFFDCYNNYKIKLSKSELDTFITQGCQKIADDRINIEIERITNLNKQIMAAQKLLKQYPDIVPGYGD